MKYRKLGRTGLEVSAICLGTMTWGSQNSEAEGHEQMDYAVGAGRQLLRHRRTLSDDAAPPKPGAIPRRSSAPGSRSARNATTSCSPPRSPVPAVPYRRWRAAVGGKDPARLRALAEAAEDRLHRPLPAPLAEPRTYHFRRTGAGSRKTHDGEDEGHFAETLETLAALVKEGKVRHFGLSNETVWGTMNAICACAEDKGWPRIASMQNEYSLLHRIFDTDLRRTRATRGYRPARLSRRSPPASCPASTAPAQSRPARA
jgi:hypothetical protein